MSSDSKLWFEVYPLCSDQRIDEIDLKWFFIFSVCQSPIKERRGQSKRMNLVLVMSEFAPICIYLVMMSPLVSLIPFGSPFAFSSNSSTSEKLSAHECDFDPSGDARSQFK